MRAYSKEILENVIAYIAQEYPKTAKKELYQTMLYKILALYDFRILRETGRPSLDLKYLAMDHGPVPKELFSNWDKCGFQKVSHASKIDKVSGKEQITISAVEEPDLDYISEYEKEILDELLGRYARPSVNTAQVSRIAHKEIKSWDKKYKENPNAVIDKLDEFPGVLEKEENKLSYIEEVALLNRALELI